MPRAAPAPAPAPRASTPTRPGIDVVCVQSYDGQLSFFEGEAHAFSRFLPDFLIPGPLCYW
jgi:hypothetical protein